MTEILYHTGEVLYPVQNQLSSCQIGHNQRRYQAGVLGNGTGFSRVVSRYPASVVVRQRNKDVGYVIERRGELHLGKNCLDCYACELTISQH